MTIKFFFLIVQRTTGTHPTQAGCAPGSVWTLCVAQLVTFSLRVVVEGSRILDLPEFSFLIRNRTAVTVQSARCFFYRFPKHGDFVAYKSYKCRHVPERCRARGNNDSDATGQGCLKRHSFLVTQVWNMQKLYSGYGESPVGGRHNVPHDCQQYARGFVASQRTDGTRC
jgi:hypothetical protein